jgi:5-methyltetrahydropteroyltriglutamate--homocysteine methyltransferase
MAEEKTAPFRANHVGSLLRPPELLEAREKHQKSEISAAQLRAVEDRSIRDAVKMQEDVGMQGVTDGEFRRTLWHADFLSQFDGVKVVEGLLPDSARHFQNPDSDVQRSPTQFVVTGKLLASARDRDEKFQIPCRAHKKYSKAMHSIADAGSLPHRPGGRGQNGLSRYAGILR